MLILMIFCLMAFKSVREYRFLYPKYFPKPKYNFQQNPLQQANIDLGRVLFYDPILSKDNTISCASCHSPYNAFAHSDHDLSHGINDQIGTRNAPTLFNLAWQSSFMWDGAINHLDVQALAPISHPKEMAENIKHLIDKLQQKELYRKMFWAAYKDSLITGERLLKALSQFQLTLVSSNAKYDQVKQNKAHFTSQEQNGYQLFLNNCNSCHKEPLFSNDTFANNGLAIDATLNDYGKGRITHKKEDSLRFKVPSLRNLSYSSPYMHDGRFKTLYQVLSHYTQENKGKTNIANEIKESIDLDATQKIDLIAFLLTLNDSSFIFNPKHHYPTFILNKK